MIERNVWLTANHIIQTKMKQSKPATRILLASTGLALSGVGVGMFLHCNLGVDPASVLTQGIGNVFHLRYGYAASLINIVILAVVLLVDRRYIGVASVMAVFLIGFTADFTSLLLTNIIPAAQLHIAARCGMVFIGCTIMGIGIATYIRTDLGVGAIDLVSEIISAKSGLPYRWVRVAGDISFVALGYCLGGVAGIGTLAAALLTGPMVQLCRPIVYKVLDPLLANHS